MHKRTEQLKVIQDECRNIFDKKVNDYGESFSLDGVVGVIIRMGDKIHRMKNITSKGIHLVEDESLRDTLLDLHNYAAMAVMLLDERSS